MREHLVGDADMAPPVGQVAQRYEPQPVTRCLDVDFRPVVFPEHRGLGHVAGAVAELLAIARIVILEEAVQEGGVGRVDADFQRLQPVAFPPALPGEAVGLRRGETVEVRQGLWFPLPQPGEDHAVAFEARIRRLAHAPVQVGAFGLGRLLQAGAGHVVEPAVERAAQAAVFQPAEGEVGAAVAAMAVDQAEPPGLVAEQHQILPEQPHGLHRARVVRFRGQFLRQRDRLPVAPHQRAAGGAGAGPGQQGVLFRGQHGGARMPRPAAGVQSCPRRAGRLLNGANPLRSGTHCKGNPP